MSTIFAIALSAHVLLGVLGLIASFATTLLLFKLGSSSTWRQRWAWTAFGAYITSWLSGGYYYVFYYGNNVKPIIKAGEYPWAHLVFMEFKEHAFLFLPVATFAVALAVRSLIEEKHAALLNSIRWLSLFITIIALTVTLSGIIVSGSAQ